VYFKTNMKWLDELIGGGQPDFWQMSFRALVVFLAALIYIRFSGRRAFGLHSSFDNVLSILLGAVLARAITGDSPFYSTLFAAFVLAFLHRLFAWLTLKSDFVGKIIKGEALPIYRDGQLIEKNMQKCLITHKDLLENMRHNNIETLDEVSSANVERSGKISFIKKRSPLISTK
jgi:uncharacterized membrane protein YcaP (DUF421 family)